MYDQTVFPAQEMNQQLHKDVKHICLIAATVLMKNCLHISDSIEVQGIHRKHDREPGHHRVHLKYIDQFIRMRF